MSRVVRAVVGVAMIAVALSPIGWALAPMLIPLGASLVLGAVLEQSPGRTDRLQQQSVLVRSAVKPQEVAYGRVRKSGVVVFYDTSGNNNEYLWFVVAVVEHEINAFEKLWIDDVEIDVLTEIDGSGYVTNSNFVNAASENLVKTGFYTGASSQTADAELVAAFSDWGASHNGNDVTYFWVRCELDTSEGGTDPDNPEANVWSKGWPRDLSVTFTGKKVYDPRLDSTQTTIPGSGSHRLATPSTWEWSENPILCRADYLMSDRFGPGYSSTDIDWDVVAAQADICEQSVTLPDFSTQDQYTLNGIIDTSDTPKNIIEGMQSADFGSTLFLSDGVKILAGSWPTAGSSHTIDETWLAGTVHASSARSTDDAYNAVRGQYISAEQDYQLVEFAPRTSSAYETEDGVGRVWQDIVLPFTTDELRAQRLALIQLKKSRQQAAVKMECNYRAELIELFQIVTLNFAGFGSDTYRVIGKSSSTNGITTLDLREEVSGDWSYAPDDLAEPPTIPDISRTDKGPQPPTNLTTTTVVNGVLLEWNNASMISVSHIEVYGSTDNDRNNATILTKTKSESYLHELTADAVRYYWIIARAENGLTSDWEPLGATSGVQGTGGEAGADGDDAVRYYIKPTNGTALKNSVAGDDFTVTDTSISATNANNRYWDDNNGFGGFAVNDHIRVIGFSNSANNIADGVITAKTANTITIGGTDGDGIVDESAGNEVTISVLSTITVEAHKTTGATDAILSSGSIKLYVGGVEVTAANGFGAGSDGYTGVFDAGDIENNVVVELRDGPAGTIYDTITLVDVADGGDAVYGYIVPSQALAWTRDADQSTWTPSSGTLQLDVTFVQGGIEVARWARELTRDAAGDITDNGAATHTDGNLNTSRISVVALDDDSQAVTIKFTYSSGGKVSIVSETAISTVAGEHGLSAALTNPSPVVRCDVEGYNYALTSTTIDNAGGTFEVTRGGSSLNGTINDMFAQGTGWTQSGNDYYKEQNGVRFNIDQDSGVYTCTVSATNSYRAWTSDAEQFSVIATIGSVVYTRIFNITKAFAGASLSVNTKMKGITPIIASTSAYGSATLRMDSDGDFYHQLNNDAATNEGDWLLTGSASEYDVKVQVLEGDSSKMSGATLDSWLSLGTDRSYTLTDSTSDTPETVTVLVTIRRNSSGEELSERTVFMSADKTAQ